MSTDLPEHLRPIRQSGNNLFVSYPANHVGRDFVVGDIHGHFRKLQELLNDAGFDEETDRLFAVGDLVDRGPESILAFRWTSKPWFLSVRGNHEQWCIDAGVTGLVDSVHQNYGGEWFYDLPESARLAYAKVFLQLPVAIEFQHESVGRVGLVHAECPYADWEVFTAAVTGGLNDAIDSAMWARTRLTYEDTSTVASVDRIYVGHSVVEGVSDYGNTRYIDTGCGFDGGELTLVQIA